MERVPAMLRTEGGESLGGKQARPTRTARCSSAAHGHIKMTEASHSEAPYAGKTGRRQQHPQRPARPPRPAATQASDRPPGPRTSRAISPRELGAGSVGGRGARIAAFRAAEA